MSRSAGRDRLILELRRSVGPAILFLLLILAGVFAGVTVIRNLAGDKPWVSYASYKVGFDNVKGVVPGRAELRIAGIKAGSVSSSKLENGQAVLGIKIEKKYAPLHTDAKVVIRPVTALEDEYVDILSRGSSNAPLLKEGQVLPATQTKSQVEVGRVLNVLDSDTRARFSSLIDQLGAGTNDRGAKLKEGFAQLGPFLQVATRLGEALSSRRQNTARLVHNFANITEVLGKRDQQLTGFVDNGGQLLGTLAQHDGTLSSTIAQLPGTLRNLQTTFANVRQTTVPLDAALKSLKPVAKSLPSGLDSLSDFSDDATPAVTSLRPSVKALKPLARELPLTSQNASDALTPLVPQATQLARGAKIVTPCLPIVGTFVSRIQSIAKYGDGGYVANARATVGVGFAGIGNYVKDIDWRIQGPCTGDAASAIKNNDQPGAKSSSTPLPSRDDAVSQEQK
ncbi:MlaD family protein [Patulibacter sp. NPDC049589]|uniref:MlaD family protein n=1 Tax=Patulibacter sp. NPDC049589 TaxID=3154731 RepID=UPI00343F51ED